MCARVGGKRPAMNSPKLAHPYNYRNLYRATLKCQRFIRCGSRIHN